MKIVLLSAVGLLISLFLLRLITMNKGLIEERNQVLIRAAPVVVFEYITDTNKMSEWVNGILEIKILSDTKKKIGDQIQILVEVPSRMEITSTVKQWDYPKHLQVTHDAMGMTGEVNYKMRSDEGLTLLSFSAIHEPQSFWLRFFSPLIGYSIKQHRAKELLRLKKVIEASTSQ